MSEESKRRGIDGAAAALRASVVKSGGRDPGQGACVARVREAVNKKQNERKG
jgi:hypothetical protein